MNIAKSLSFLAYSLFLILAVYLYEQPYAQNYLYGAVCIFALVANWQHVNTSSLIGLLLITKMLEIITLSHLKIDIYVIHSFYFALDLSVTLIIALRPALCRKAEHYLTGQPCDPKKYSITNADMLVGVI